MHAALYKFPRVSRYLSQELHVHDCFCVPVFTQTVQCRLVINSRFTHMLHKDARLPSWYKSKLYNNGSKGACVVYRILCASLDSVGEMISGYYTTKSLIINYLYIL